ncbi:SLAM family member 5-like [Rhinoraja longicauda]
MDIRCLLCCVWLSLPISIPGTGAAAGTVTGARGHSVSLPAGITVAPDDDSVVWTRTSSPKTIIAKYSNGNIKYYDSNYTGRVTLHRGNFSLEIHDLRREDAGDYEVDVVTRTGSETLAIVRLEVYEPVAGTHIQAQNITGICNFTLICSVTSGDPTSFRWWRGEEALGNDSTHHLRGHGETVEVHHTAEVGDVVYKCEARNPASEGTAEIRLMDVCKQTTPGEWLRGNQV